jgi:hypothetical protein
MSLYWAKNRNMMPTMIRATAIATDAELPLLPAAIRFLPATENCGLLRRPATMSLSSQQLFFPFVGPRQQYSFISA